MASEYLKWLARNEKPAEKKELTPKEKRANWWYYHKWAVLAGAAVLVLAIFLIADTVIQKNNQPDYQVAYVGSHSLPEDTVTALEQALAAFGQDLNGNGEVRVLINQYIFYDNMQAYAEDYSAQIQLMADISNCTSFLYLMNDPQTLQETFEVLAYPDGRIPEEGTVDPDTWLAWTDCPVLAELELGGYTKQLYEQTLSGDNQALLSELYIGRRIITEHHKFPLLAEHEAFWEKLIAGAAQ